jgi:hypothetical protein
LTIFLQNNKLIPILIAVIAGLLFIPFIGNCHLFDWDEVNFAECAREMITSGDYSHVQLNYRPFWEKPPLFIWLQALSMKFFGVNEFAARLPNALCSIASLQIIYFAGKKFHSPSFGLVWCLLYVTSILPHLYFKSGLIDPWFNLFIFISVYYFIQFVNDPSGSKSIGYSLVSGVFLGLAVLTKGPAALLIVGLTITILALLHKAKQWLFTRSILLFAASALLVSSAWFIVEWMNGNGEIIEEFIDYQIRLFKTGDSGHEGPILYHFIVLLIGCFPASLIFIAAYLKYKDLTPFQKLFRKILLILFWVVLLLFSIVKTKIIHYSSLCYFPLTFIATIGLINYFDRLKFNLAFKIVYWIISIVISLAFTVIGFVDDLKTFLLPFIEDEFAKQNLQANGRWSGFEFLLGPLFLTGSILIYKAISKHNIKLLLGGLMVQFTFIYGSIMLIIPRVELYSQNAAIEFYKYCADKHCYVETHGFKSYAYLFYSNRRADDYTNPEQQAFIARQLDHMESEGHSRLSSFATANMLWMEHGKIDRPVYIAAKTPQEKSLAQIKGFILMYRKNGFSFFVRYPDISDK